MRWWLYFGLVILQLAVTSPRFATTCNDTSGFGSGVYLIHHLLDVYVFWGFLFLTTPVEHAIHAWVLLGIAIHWLTNNYECILTTEMNRLCGYPRTQWLDSIVDRIRPTYYTHMVWIVLAFVYDVIAYRYASGRAYSRALA